MRQADSNGITVEKFHSLLSLARYYIMTRHLERPSSLVLFSGYSGFLPH